MSANDDVLRRQWKRIFWPWLGILHESLHGPGLEFCTAHQSNNELYGP